MGILHCALLCLSLVSVAPQRDPVTVGPDIYRLAFENERVRVLEIRFAPGAKIAMHAHPDHAVYVIEGGTLNVTGEDGKTQVFDLKAGEAVFLPAQAHSAENPGTSMVRAVVVEIKDPAPMPKGR